MKDFNELKETVKKKGAGTAFFGNVNGTAVYLSRGVREVFLEKDKIDIVKSAVVRFQNGDFGNAVSYGKEEKSGHEYGRYDLCDLNAEAGEDTGVWIHQAENALLVYFRFER